MKTSLSIKILFGSLCAVILFHVGIITKIIPYTIAWGGRLNNDSEMYIFEFFSIFINLVLVFVLLMKGGFIKHYFKERIIHLILWFFFVLFALNTVVNLFAKTNFEKLFSVLTIFLASLIWTVLKGKNEKFRLNK